MGEVMVRNMKGSDLPRVLEIEQASFPVPWTGNMFQYQLGMQDVSENIVITRNGRLAGYLIGWAICDEIHILNVAVDPEERKQGHAGRMIREFVRRGRQRGAERVVLEVRRSNLGAQKMYQKYGFKIIDVIEGYYSETGEDALVMKLDLDEE